VSASSFLAFVSSLIDVWYRVLGGDGEMNGQLDIKEIWSLLPHRYPFLLVDRVLSLEPGVSIKAIKNVTINEAFLDRKSGV
jgi:hypothetical protein